MSKDPLAQIAAHIAERKAAVDAEFAPLVRNHLVQLFRAAHAVEPTLTGMTAGMGTATIDGEYTYVDEDGEHLTEANGWKHGSRKRDAKHDAVAEWLAAVADYSDRLCAELPYVDDITLDDLTTERSKRAKVWGKH